MTPARALGVILLALLVLAPLVRARTEETRLRTDLHDRKQLRVYGGVVQVPGQPADEPEFLVGLTHTVPADAHVRVVVKGGACASPGASGTFLWLGYQLAPRQIDCSAPTRWTLTIGTPPTPPPPGRIVEQSASGLRLWDAG